jgi:hypothetical protein
VSDEREKRKDDNSHQFYAPIPEPTSWDRGSDYGYQVIPNRDARAGGANVEMIIALTLAGPRSVRSTSAITS